MIERDIHLVGSVPLSTATEVFTMCSGMLGSRVRRLPDGETGDRSNWIGSQWPVMKACPQLDSVPDTLALFRLRPDRNGPPVFGALGYATAATRSWSEFQALRAEGIIAAGQRFQVSLPTPLAVVTRFVELGSQAETYAPYSAAMETELQSILLTIPAADLALQWDIAIEFEVLEGLRPVYFTPAFDGILARLRHLVSLVPADVELGLHLCYGDREHKHFKEPEDTSLMVRVANQITAIASRPLDWVHMPVPRLRDDAAYFRPLRDLRLASGCQLFLGVVHYHDGVDGARRRIAAAEPFAPAHFGIATECGFGRRDPATVPDLLRLHNQI